MNSSKLRKSCSRSNQGSSESERSTDSRPETRVSWDSLIIIIALKIIFLFFHDDCGIESNADMVHTKVYC